MATISNSLIWCTLLEVKFLSSKVDGLGAFIGLLSITQWFVVWFNVRGDLKLRLLRISVIYIK